MSFAGHVLDMIKRTNANNALIEKIRSKRKKKKDFSAISDVADNPFMFGKEVTQEELECIKSEIKKNLKKQQRKETILLVSCILGIVFVLILVYFLLK